MFRTKREIQQWIKECKQKVTYNLPEITWPSKWIVHKLAVTTNWFEPMIIEEVAKTVGWQMSPMEIVKCCQGKSLKLFHQLRADVVGKWIDWGWVTTMLVSRYAHESSKRKLPRQISH